nr:MAG TPA: hypothetical protein [Caudoviricetes sp.]
MLLLAPLKLNLRLNHKPLKVVVKPVKQVLLRANQVNLSLPHKELDSLQAKEHKLQVRPLVLRNSNIKHHLSSSPLCVIA